MRDPALTVKMHGNANSFSDGASFSKYEPIINNLAEKFAENESNSTISSPLLNKEQVKTRLKLEFKEAVRLEEQYTLLKQAVRLILSEGQNYLSQEEWDQLSSDIAKAQEKLSTLSIYDEIPEKLYPFLGITEASLDAVEKISRQKYQEENYGAAAALCAFLTTIDPENFSYWLHLGVCYQEAGFNEKAIKAFSICHLLDPLEITPWILCTECYVRAHNKDDAKLEFEEARRMISKLEDTKPWDEHLIYLKRIID